LVGWEHSLKNEMIIATKKGEPLPDKVSRYQTYLNSLPLTDDCLKLLLKLLDKNSGGKKVTLNDEFAELYLF
jgi:hypothetical protein